MLIWNMVRCAVTDIKLKENKKDYSSKKVKIKGMILIFEVPH